MPARVRGGCAWACMWLADVHTERIAQEAARARVEFELLKYGMTHVSNCAWA